MACADQRGRCRRHHRLCARMSIAVTFQDSPSVTVTEALALSFLSTAEQKNGGVSCSTPLLCQDTNDVASCRTISVKPGSQCDLLHIPGERIDSAPGSPMQCDSNGITWQPCVLVGQRPTFLPSQSVAGLPSRLRCLATRGKAVACRSTDWFRYVLLSAHGKTQDTKQNDTTPSCI